MARICCSFAVLTLALAGGCGGDGTDSGGDAGASDGGFPDALVNSDGGPSGTDGGVGDDGSTGADGGVMADASSPHPPGWVAPTAHGAHFNDMGFASCQVCHGETLEGGSAGVSCGTCHPGWETDCTFCHGGLLNSTGAPPEGIDGETERTDLHVGAHQEHVQDTAKHLGRDCTMCHVKPADVFSAGHIDGDGRAEVTFPDPLNPSASYDGATGSCTNLYCHGNGSSVLGSGDWDTDPTLGCGACHAPFSGATRAQLEAMSGEHDRHVRRQGFPCATCHSTNVDASGNLLRIDLHVDGHVDVNVSSWDSSGRGSCNPACHGSENWR